MYSFARAAAITNNKVPHTSVAETTEMYCLKFLEARSPRSRCLQGWLLLSLLSLTRRWHVFSLHLYIVFPLYMSVSKFPLLIRTPVILG